MERSTVYFLVEERSTAYLPIGGEEYNLINNRRRGILLNYQAMERRTANLPRGGEKYSLRDKRWQGVYRLQVTAIYKVVEGSTAFLPNKGENTA